MLTREDREQLRKIASNQNTIAKVSAGGWIGVYSALSMCLDDLDAQATRIREHETEIEQIKSLLGCHRAYIQESIRDLQARTEDIPNIDLLRQTQAELARVKGQMAVDEDSHL